MKQWDKLSKEVIQQRVLDALNQNVNYFKQDILGVPGSHLDEKVFYSDAPFLESAPFLTSMIRNPNHIGCHTLDHSESFFSGTQQIERELIKLCAECILQTDEGQIDGYVASGGTEANIQAIWIYRNFFQSNFQAPQDSISILCSEDSHYSMDKAANLLGISLTKVPVNANTRKLNYDALEESVKKGKDEGIEHYIVVANMMTTMFGSCDDLGNYIQILEKYQCTYKVHIDAAYGGFFFPFSNPDHSLDFSHPKVDSITLDAHKMVQAPYGTGIFLARKGLMAYTNTKEARYVEGEDFTLIGSRSGANAIAIWMILMTYGSEGWFLKIKNLCDRAANFAQQLQGMEIDFYRHINSNIITIRAHHVPKALATAYGLVPDDHHNPKWYKVVVMEHVTQVKLEAFLKELD